MSLLGAIGAVLVLGATILSELPDKEPIWWLNNRSLKTKNQQLKKGAKDKMIILKFL